MYVLSLSDLRVATVFRSDDPSMQPVKPVARADTREELEKLLQDSYAEAPYKQRVQGVGRTQPFTKYFKKGTLLEWFLPPAEGVDPIRWVGSKEEWMEKARERFENDVLSIPHATDDPDPWHPEPAVPQNR